MQINTGNRKYDVSLAKEFQHHLTKKHCKNGVFDQGVNNKRFMERKFIERKYHVQDNDDVAHQYARIFYCSCPNKTHHFCCALLLVVVEIP